MNVLNNRVRLNDDGTRSLIVAWEEEIKGEGTLTINRYEAETPLLKLQLVDSQVHHKGIKKKRPAPQRPAPPRGYILQGQAAIDPGMVPPGWLPAGNPQYFRLGGADIVAHEMQIGQIRIEGEAVPPEVQQVAHEAIGEDVDVIEIDDAGNPVYAARPPRVIDMPGEIRF